MLRSFSRSAALISVIAVALIAAASEAQAAFPGANGKIVFTVRSGGPTEGIYVVNPDGTGQTFIRPGAYEAAGYGRPRWSPDGQRIAFTSLDVANSRLELHIMNADGSGEVDTNILGHDFTWSPSGTQMLFVDSVGGRFDIFRMNADGSGVVNLTSTPGVDDLRPSWSPDGARIAFQRGQGPGDIGVMNPDGSGYTNITNTPAFEERSPDWSPDGERISFAGNPDEGNGLSPWVMNRDGSDPRKLHNHNSTLFTAWSPDGERIAVNGGFTIRTDGSDLRFFSSGPGVNQSVDWQSVTGTGANMSVFKTDSPDPAYTGEVLTYTIRARNITGPSAAGNVVVTDTLPTSVTYLGATPTQGNCSLSGATLTCNLGSLASGATATIDVRVEPQSSGTISNGVTITSDQADPDPTNNQATQQTTVNPVVGYARPKGASPLRIPLVPAYVMCSGPDRAHGPPLAYPSCAPPVQYSPHITVGTPDVNGAAANSIGSIHLVTLVGDPGTSSDEADVRFTVSLTDVREKRTLADYEGELEIRTSVRTTDRLNGNPEVFPGTVEDWTLRATTSCSATGSGTVGATCSLTTTADAVVPGLVKESKRTIWQLGQVRVFDGGEDGLVASDDNVLFGKQGIFIP